MLDVTAALERLKKLDEAATPAILALKSAAGRLLSAEKRWIEAHTDPNTSESERSTAYEEWYGEMRAYSTYRENVSTLLTYCNALPALIACAEQLARQARCYVTYTDGGTCWSHFQADKNTAICGGCRAVETLAALEKAVSDA